MTIYRLHDVVDGAPINTRYFRDRARAMKEAEHLVKIYEAIHEVTMARQDVNQFDILTVWTSPDGDVTVRLEQGEVED